MINDYDDPRPAPSPVTPIVTDDHYTQVYNLVADLIKADGSDDIDHIVAGYIDTATDKILAVIDEVLHDARAVTAGG
ncbi:hypothetical protein [Leifsonia sp. Leaf264]|uniref:hypothetical protein n=1 Tax=Leifsonia sp. Leaf264 TaxID=1736314 RepID=UPI0006F28856|nr:hypothetical protein [Leifsonia sp. Leaf264]KQO98343.1 hypothetical protein ASF30_09795 [Leifsonia sp. Leaf264]